MDTIDRSNTNLPAPFQANLPVLPDLTPALPADHVGTPTLQIDPKGLTTGPQLCQNLLPAGRPPARRHQGDIISESAGDLAGICIVLGAIVLQTAQALLLCALSG